MDWAIAKRDLPIKQSNVQMKYWTAIVPIVN